MQKSEGVETLGVAAGAVQEQSSGTLRADLITSGDDIATAAGSLEPRTRAEKRGAGAEDAGFDGQGRPKREPRRKSKPSLRSVPCCAIG